MTHLGSLPRGFRVVRLAGDVLVGPIAFLLAFLVRLYVPVPMTRSLLPLDRISFYAEHWIPVVITQVAVLYFFAFYDPPQPASRTELLRRLVAATCLQGLVLMGYYFLARQVFPRSVLLLFVPLNCLLLYAWRLLVWRVRPPRRRRVAIVGAGPAAAALAQSLRAPRPATGSSWWASSGPSPVGAGGRHPGVRRRARADAGNRRRRAASWSRAEPSTTSSWPARARRGRPGSSTRWRKARSRRSNVWLLPGPFESLIAGTRFSWVDDHPLIEVARDPDWRINWPLKRLFDVVVGGLLLIALAPVLLIGALCVLIDSGRPIFYRQVRIGRGGAPFTIVKLRTMRAGAEDSTGEALATSTDPRVTASRPLAAPPPHRRESRSSGTSSPAR